MKEAGNLEGILLTGLTKDGVDLMESYVDRTGDVQTASYCMLQVSAVWQQQFIKEKKKCLAFYFLPLRSGYLFCLLKISRRHLTLI